jgi:hypothetical protein
MTRGHPVNRHSERVRKAATQNCLHSPRSKHHRLRCDCGQLAITVLRVRVGTDPQYTINLPLCPSCLALEQSFKAFD